MRFGMMGLAAAALLAAAPANASTLFFVSGDATVTIDRETYGCPTSHGPGCVINTTFEADKLIGTQALYLEEGANAFSYGGPRVSGRFEGTIINTAGFLTGINLSYYFDGCGAGIPNVGCYFERGTARTFNVTGGVPEMSTWAMMLAGFGMMGYMLRRRSARTMRLALVS